jgi:hypothetical protein
VYGVRQGQAGGSQLVSRTQVRDQRFYESQMTRLYYYHGSAQAPQPVVVDWEPRETQFRGQTVVVNGTPADGRMIKQFRTMDQARAYVQNDSTSQIGGLGAFPSERVPALEHYRLVDVSENAATDVRQYRALREQARATYAIRPEAASALDANPPSYVKTFERVPGARIEGSGAQPNANVTAEVPLYVPQTNTTFTYTQRVEADENGEFTMTLPYATTGYDAVSPADGYTNTSIRAQGPYNVTGGVEFEGSNVTTFQAQTEVPERTVVGASSETVEVELTERTQPLFGNSGGSGSTTVQNQSAVRPPGPAPTATTAER